MSESEIIWAGDGKAIPPAVAAALRMTAEICWLQDGTLKPGVSPDGELTDYWAAS